MMQNMGIPCYDAYAAVSYPWIGLNPSNDPNFGTFKVRQDNGRPGDPISIKLLIQICHLALESKARYLWLDRLCVSQVDDGDKLWQIHRMCGVYKACSLCIIVPGGLQRLANMDEETPWITRMWTLQEAVIPRRAMVLYSPPNVATGRSLPVGHFWDQALDMCYGHLSDLTATYMDSDGDCSTYLLGQPSQGLAQLLHKALTSYSDSSSSDNGYERYLAIWQSAITRSADRPQDLLLSTMGIFNIQLKEGVQRSREEVFSAFVDQLRKEGHKGARITAFREAVSQAGSSESVSCQWKTLIDDLHRAFPLLEGGLSPTPYHGLPIRRCGPPIYEDFFGDKIFLGSALIAEDAGHSLQPCPINVSTPTRFHCLTVTPSSIQTEHHGHWEILPFYPEKIEWIYTHSGHMPSSASPVEGGYEKFEGQDASLYYALVQVVGEDGMKEEFIGKVGRHLVSILRYLKLFTNSFQTGCIYMSGGQQHVMKRGYQVL